MGIEKFFDAAVKFDASDLFLSSGKVPSYRVNGAIVPTQNIPPIEGEKIDIFRDSCLNENARNFYNASGGADCSFIHNGNRFRLNFFDSINGPCLVARLLHNGGDCDFAKLNLAPEIMTRIAAANRGIIIITGTTGSGKSTTMSAIINHINSTMSKHILTLEDPIEYIHQDKMSLISQREITSAKGGFSEALRNALRENPDVIVVGEIRDSDTVNTAINAALTGHLVITTMHTADAASAVERMLEMFPENERDTVASSLSIALEAIIAQRLLPLNNNKGMIPALDILIATDIVKKHITNQNVDELYQCMKQGFNAGMTTFNNSLLELLRKGMISADSALRASDTPDELRLMQRGMIASGASSQTVYSGKSSANNQIDMRDLFKAAIKAGASDLLITVGVPPQLHVNGNFVSLELPVLNGADVQRLVFSLLDRRQRTILEEKRDLDFAISVKTGESNSRRFRLNAFYQRGSVALTARLISENIPTPSALGLPPILTKLVSRKQGLMIITGPTGSGKSTTMASLLDLVNHQESRHVITIEDPIEYIYNHDRCVIEQREIGSDATSFANGLRAAMRQAPDIIMVGEMRDMETIQAAITAAETGHLVLGTLHSNNTCQTVERIIDSFPANQQNQIRQQLSGCILAVVAQRLIPRCDVPNQRIGAFEVMTGTTAVKALIRDNKTHQLMSVIESSAQDGMLSMTACLNSLVSHGIISEEERRKFETGS